MISPNLYRKLIPKLVNNSFTYLPGMFLVRQARKDQKKANTVTHKSEKVVIENFAGSLKMKVDKFSYMGGSIFWSGYHHLNEFLYLKKFLKPNMVFIDAGANQGEFAVFAADKLQKGNVICFEPVKTNLVSLYENIQLNEFENIKVHEFGLFNEEKELQIYTSDDSVLNRGRHEGLSTIFPDEYRNKFEEVIQLKVFDDLFLNELKRFDFLKIDIEGSELFALKGMQKSIEKFKPQVLIELNDDTYSSAGYSIEEVIDFFEKLNYSLFTIFRGRLIKTKWTSQTKWGNFLFIDDSKV